MRGLYWEGQVVAAVRGTRRKGENRREGKGRREEGDR